MTLLSVVIVACLCKKSVYVFHCVFICDPQRRSRSVEVFGQFGGQACTEPIGQSESCQTNATCDRPPPPACADSEFQCESGSFFFFNFPAGHSPLYYLKPFKFNTHLCTGYCIKRRLMCNGDYDCEDGSDEDCVTQRKPCATTVALDTNEQSRTAGYG